MVLRGSVMALGMASLLGVFGRADACTTFALPLGKLLTKSYDWHIDHGMVLINQRGVEKRGFALTTTDVPPTWTSTYGSLTFNQYGREFPNAGLNEAGLVVEVMVLEGSTFPAASATPSLNETQWVQYQLDRFATVDEVVQHIHDVRVARVFQSLHYLVCDKTGACAAVEMIDGDVVVHSGPSMDVQVLANDTYEAGRTYLERFSGFGGSSPVPTNGLSSLTRYVRAADHVRRAPLNQNRADRVAYAFQGIDKVASDATQWRIVYEMTEGTVHFASLSAPQIKSVSTTGLNFSCAALPLMLSMGTPQSGDVTDELVAYTAAANAAVVHRSLDGQLPATVIERALAYPSTTHCVTP